MILALLARWGVPERIRKPLAYLTAAVVLIALLWAVWAIWLHNHDKGVIERHEEKITKQVGAVSSEAAASASAAVDQSRNLTELENAQASEAAASSSDPLGDGLRSLRAGKSSDKPPSR